MGISSYVIIPYMTYILDEQSVISADLDGTLTASKSAMTPEMALVISEWLTKHRFAIISGGEHLQFEKQVVSRLPEDTNLKNLYLFPTNGSACYEFKDEAWRAVYSEKLTDDEQNTIAEAIEEAVIKSGIVIEAKHGNQIAFRGGQVTFSALGQDAPLGDKAPWDPDQEKRKNIVSHLAPLLPDFTISIGGTTSIDVTKKGIDKAYAIEKMKTLLNVDNEHILFLGDALFPGGNDYPAERTGVNCIKVSGPEETLKIISQNHQSAL